MERLSTISVRFGVRRLDAAFDDEARLVTLQTPGLTVDGRRGGPSTRPVKGGVEPVEPPHSKAMTRMDDPGRSAVSALRRWRLVGARNVFAVTIIVLGAGCVAPLHEPANLDLAKQEIRRYVASHAYDRDLERVAEQANQWIERRVAVRKAGERLAVVFDVDETLLRNVEQMEARDFGYDETDWERWVMSASAKPLEAVCGVFRAAQRLGVEIVVITGRPEHQREATIENLRSVGCAGYALLICKPEEATPATMTDFKIAERRRLVRDGWVIIANVGDQRSDLDGGYAERAFKLPNPFYLTP